MNIVDIIVNNGDDTGELLSIYSVLTLWCGADDLAVLGIEYLLEWWLKCVQVVQVYQVN